MIRNILILCTVLFCQNIFCQNSNCKLLVFEDEFDGTSLDNSNWTVITGHGFNQSELQYFSSSADNVSVSGGMLHITAQEESFNQYNYTSGAIQTRDKVDWKYGCIESRMKLPEGQGFWPAFWLMPQLERYGFWPTSGEIDIMEFLGHDTDVVYTTAHYGTSAQNHMQSSAWYILPTGDYVNEFHTFGIEWSPDLIIWKVDGIQVFQLTSADLGAGVPWPFNHEFFMILNLSVGGDWPGSPDNTTPFPSSLAVDYVRVYQYLDLIEIAGDCYVQPNTSPLTYSVPVFPGATYTWSLPGDMQLLSGQNTNTITVNSGTDGGAISVQVEHNCETVNITKTVNVDCNALSNGNFEEHFIDWYQKVSAPSSYFFVDETTPFDGIGSGCVEISQLGGNWWDDQLVAFTSGIVPNSTYTISFYAKSSTAGAQINFALQDNVNYSTAFTETVTLSNIWTQYTFTYTSSGTDNDLGAFISFGFDTGTFCFDNIQIIDTSVCGCPNAGNACDDGIVCTTGDIYDTACNCAGIFVDSDGDGVCDANDKCPGFDDAIDTDGDGTPDGCTTNMDCNSLSNGYFEDDFNGWYQKVSSPTSSFYIDNATPFAGNASACVEVNQLGTDWWDEQLIDFNSGIVPNTSYYISFYAKSSFAGLQLNFALSHNVTYTSELNQTVSLNTAWTQYTFSYTSSSTANDIGVFLSFGFNTGTYCFDNIEIINTTACGCPYAGTACDDGDFCTTNDTFDSNCNCTGTLTDSDNDGVCDAKDRCPGFDDSIDTDGDGTPDGCVSCWDLTYEDNFDVLDLSKYNTQYIWPREQIINQELQYYADPTLHGHNPFSVTNGILSITAEPTPASMSNITSQPYVSGVLTTRQQFEQLYGKFEIRARLPEGQGLWPAFWALPTHASWPSGVAVLPELDIMEYLGHEGSVYHVTRHSNQTGSLVNVGTSVNTNADLNNEFHTYTAIWNEETITWLFDGQVVFCTETPADFHIHKHVLLNLAVGGSWPGNPDANTVFPAHFEIDYLRVYQKPLITTTGTSCDDGDVCTTGDVYDGSCNCVGTFADADNDGVCDVNDKCAGSDDTVDVDVNGIPDGCDNFSFGVKVMLCGFTDGIGSMSNNLLTSGLLPNAQPFSSSPWIYNGNETVSTFPSDMVDWLLLILRDANGNPISSKAVLLISNGDVLDVNGSSSIEFQNLNFSDTYQLSVHSRSHLAVLSSSTISSSEVFDFTESVGKAKGTAQQNIHMGEVCLYAGDYDGNGIINNIDYNNWRQNAAANSQYLPIDGDGSAVVNNLDYNLWYRNRSKIGEPEIRY